MTNDAICEFCDARGPNGRSCLSRQEPGEVFGYDCTRLRGHSGDHVACGGSRHDIARWPPSWRRPWWRPKRRYPPT
jgi:hypothetical protein